MSERSGVPAMRVASNEHGEAGEPAAASDQLLTVPNVLSVLRIASVPVFLYLILVPHADGWALGLLLASGFTDWADGKLARVLDQSSEIGALLDPVADRLYMVATPVAFAVRGFVPWWLVGLLIGREVVLACTLPAYRSRGLAAPEVHYLGKAATFALMFAFPFLLAAQGHSDAADALRPWAVALLVWGTALYVWTAVLYLIQTARVLRLLPRAGSPAVPARKAPG